MLIDGFIWFVFKENQQNFTLIEKFKVKCESIHNFSIFIYFQLNHDRKNHTTDDTLAVSQNMHTMSRYVIWPFIRLKALWNPLYTKNKQQQKKILLTGHNLRSGRRNNIHKGIFLWWNSTWRVLLDWQHTDA